MPYVEEVINDNITAIRRDTKNRSSVTISVQTPNDKKPYLACTYRFNKIDDRFDSVYMSWRNVYHAVHIGKDDDEGYLSSAVEKGTLPLASSFMFDPFTYNTYEKAQDYLASIQANLPSGLVCAFDERHCHIEQDGHFWGYYFICKDTTLNECYQLDEVIEHLAKLGVSLFAEERQMLEMVFSYKLTEYNKLINSISLDVRYGNRVGMIAAGLMLGFPIEAICWHLECKYGSALFICNETASQYLLYKFLL